jgi:membrane protein
MLSRIWQLITRTFQIWASANASRMSAALTYYTMLSLAPTLMIAIAIAGYVYDNKVAESEIIEQVTTITTPEIAKMVAGLITNAVKPESGFVAGTISICVLVFAASGVFTQLYDTFNDIWGVSQDHRNGVLLELQKRLIGIGIVIAIGILLITAILINSAVAYLTTAMNEYYPGAVTWLNLLDRSLSFLLLPFVFTVAFWFFPATKIQLRDVWPAGILTACMVGASRYLIGIYLSVSTTSEVYGAAGSLVILLIWVYITGLVVFFGASFSHAWAQVFGSRSKVAESSIDESEIVSNEDEAEITSDEESVKQPAAVEVSSPQLPLVPTRRA